MQQVFITGGSGFVGRHLIARLVGQGVVVKALVRSAKAAEIVRQAGAEPIAGNLAEETILRQAMQDCQVVFHVAARVEDWGSYADFYQDNVTGTEQVLAAAKAAGVKRFVHVSTEAVLVGEGAPAIVNADESWPRAAKPLGLYPLTKGLAEERVLAANGPEFSTIIVRPRLIWGKGDTSLLPQIIKAVKAGSFAWVGGGRYLTSTCHVVNVCEGAILAAEKGRGGEIYFLTDGAPQEFRTFLTSQLRSQGVEPGNRTIPRPVARAGSFLAEKIWQTFKLKGAPPITRTAVRLIGEEVTVNDSKARRELGYTAQVSVSAGLAEMQAN